MGDPRKLTNKYETPRKLWDLERINSESKLSSAYGMKNAREIWVAVQELKKARRNAIKLLSLGAEGVEKGKPLLARLCKLGIMGPDATLDDVLSLSIENFLDRRLQTRVMKKGLARTPMQARQLITHGYIGVKGKRVTIPSYMVTAEEDQYIAHYKPIDISVHEEDKSAAKKSPNQEASPAAAEAPKAETA